MLRLIGKDIFLLSGVLMLLPLTLAYWLFTGSAVDTEMLFIAVIVTFLSGPVVLVISEQREDKYHGYAFLAQLPLTMSDIIGSRFLQVLLLESVIVLFYRAVLTFFPGGEGNLPTTGNTLVILSGLLCLLTSGLLYLGIIKFGFIIFIRVVMVIILTLFLIPPLFLQFHIDIKIDTIIRFLNNLNITMVIMTGLLIYLSLMYLTIRAAAKSKIK